MDFILGITVVMGVLIFNPLTFWVALLTLSEMGD
tara:strand:- start:310 stop:411 length:102 start_codon:yes stop_codon:yes gene_type:complete